MITGSAEQNHLIRSLSARLALLLAVDSQRKRVQRVGRLPSLPGAHRCPVRDLGKTRKEHNKQHRRYGPHQRPTDADESARGVVAGSRPHLAGAWTQSRRLQSSDRRLCATPRRSPSVSDDHHARAAPGGSRITHAHPNDGRRPREVRGSVGIRGGTRDVVHREAARAHPPEPAAQREAHRRVRALAPVVPVDRHLRRHVPAGRERWRGAHEPRGARFPGIVSDNRKRCPQK